MELQELINHVKDSIVKSYNNTSKVSYDILKIDGMSGNKTRHLYNNICNLENSTYLEVGTWKGSSFISAMYKNPNTYGICIDNWSEFGGPREEFFNNLNTHIENKNIKIIDKDCWEITDDDINKTIDIYMYDGEHSYESQKKAITYYNKFFSKYIIIMIDDWICWQRVIDGTIAGIKEMNLIIHYFYEIPLVNTNNFHIGGDTFWNGCGIFVCERTIY